MNDWDRIAADGRIAPVLIRHGRTAWNAERRFLGSSDLPLDPQGLAEVERLAPLRSAFSAIYTSPLAGALQTAEALSPPPVRRVDALRELHHGALEGLTQEEALSRFPEFFQAFSTDPTELRIPGERPSERSGTGRSARSSRSWRSGPRAIGWRWSPTRW